MPVYLAAADESEGPKQDGWFLFGGFVAPADDWTRWFEPAWEDRVLKGPPRIPYLHMADIRSPKWWEQYGLSRLQASDRIDEAVWLIRTMGSLGPVQTQFNGGDFREAFKDFDVVRLGSQPGVYSFGPDYVGFLGFCYAALEYAARFGTDVERVNFLVERKKNVSHHFPDYLQDLGRLLREKGHPDLEPLVGKVEAADKKSIPVQAADLLMWHRRRYESFTATSEDLQRLHVMLGGRYLMESEMTREQVAGIAQRGRANPAPTPFPSRTRRK